MQSSRKLNIGAETTAMLVREMQNIAARQKRDMKERKKRSEKKRANKKM